MGEYSAAQKKYWKSDKAKATKKRYNDSEKGKLNLRNKNIRRYGITPEEYDAMFAEQEGSCAVCHKHQTEISYGLCIDHVHGETGLESVRGLLCKSCNTAIGQLGDNLEGIMRVVKYLHKYEGENGGGLWVV
jgi:hypothetical protein